MAGRDERYSVKEIVAGDASMACIYTAKEVA